MTVYSRLIFIPVIILLVLLYSCNRIPDQPWFKAIPSTSTALIVPDNQGGLTSALDSEFIPFLQSISHMPLDYVSQVENEAATRLLLEGLVIHPAGSNKWAPVWISRKGSKSAEEISRYFERPFTENTYRVHGVTIYRFFMPDSDVIMHAAQFKSYIILSPSSYALEAFVRGYLGIDATMNVSNPQPGEIVINFPSLDKFVKMYGAVRFRPLIDHAFEGLESTTIRISDSPGRENRRNYKIEGTAGITDRTSTLVRLINSVPTELTLDRQIPADAAVFGMYAASESINLNRIEAVSALDSSIAGQPGLISAIAGTLGSQTGFVGFNTMGFSSLEETAYIRKLRSPRALKEELDRLVNRGHITEINDYYTIHSRYLASLIGSELCPYTQFYIGFHNDFVILAPRLGLIQRIVNDNLRRRVMYYDDEYLRFRRNQPAELSAFFYINSAQFKPFIKPYTDPVTDVNPFLSFFDVMTLGFKADRSAGNATFAINSYAIARVEQPIADRWFYPLSDTEITGPAVVTNLEDTRRSDIVFATTGNRVIALASDGTELFRAGTGENKPIGSPAVYDWYSNNQNAVLIAAGKRIYAWNNRGESLPGFPFILEEEITSPIVIADVSRSGLPEIIVTTADRNIHVLNARGNNIDGWPQRTNSVIEESPVYAQYNGQRSIIAFAQNGVFAWSGDGQLRNGFPVFTESGLIGKPLLHENTIFAGGADGRLYSISLNEQFTGGSAVTHSADNGDNGLYIQSINVSDSPLLVAGVADVTTTDEFELPVESTALYSLSANGAVFLYNLDGELLFTQSMGQPAELKYKPVVLDLNRNGKLEITATAAFGRLYAWDIRNEKLLGSLPTTAVQHPVFVRLAGDNNINLIAGTREGLRSWVILR